jgi:hypothetical protein
MCGIVGPSLPVGTNNSLPATRPMEVTVISVAGMCSLVSTEADKGMKGQV